MKKEMFQILFAHLTKFLSEGNVCNKTKQPDPISWFQAFMSKENLQKHVILNKIVVLCYSFKHI